MATLSIILPDGLAKASQAAAGRLGISRTQFIRQAIAHELAKLEAQLEQEAMVEAFSAMKENKQYLEESEELTEQLNSELPNEEEDWWKKKS